MTVAQLMLILSKSNPEMQVVVRKDRARSCMPIKGVDIGGTMKSGVAYTKNQDPDQVTGLAIMVFV